MSLQICVNFIPILSVIWTNRLTDGRMGLITERFQYVATATIIKGAIKRNKDNSKTTPFMDSN